MPDMEHEHACGAIAGAREEGFTGAGESDQSVRVVGILIFILHFYTIIEMRHMMH